MVTSAPSFIPSPLAGLGVKALLKVTQPRDHDHRVPGGKGQTFFLQEELENGGYRSRAVPFPPAAD